MSLDQPPETSTSSIGLQLAVAAIVGIVGTAAVIESLWYVVGDTRERYQGDVYYSVSVRAAGDAPFTMMVPVPVDTSGNPAPFLSTGGGSSGDVVGSAVVETTHGAALALSGQGNVWWARTGPPPYDVQPVASYSVRHPGRNFDLSMWQENSTAPPEQALGNVWLYFDGAGSPDGYAVALSMIYPDSTIHQAEIELHGSEGWVLVQVTSMFVPPPVF